MREIKFRAWDATAKDMVYFGLGEDNFSTYCEEDRQCYTLLLEHKPPVMQYTGLKDKNGKEIYEGDIVIAWSEGYCHTGEIKWRLEGQPAIIIYPAFGNQGFWKIHGSKNIDGTYSDDGVEIIGNIYEHPHLLNTKP